MELTIYTDGASRNKPGEAGAGIYILQDGDRSNGSPGTSGRHEQHREYTAAIIGLEHAVKAGAGGVSLFADSELMVKQLTASYKVKNEGSNRSPEGEGAYARIGSVEVQYIRKESRTRKRMRWRTGDR